jgi:hypothetical protein
LDIVFLIQRLKIGIPILGFTVRIALHDEAVLIRQIVAEKFQFLLLAVFKGGVGIFFERRRLAERTIRRVKIDKVHVVPAEILSNGLIISRLTDNQLDRTKQLVVSHYQLPITNERLLAFSIRYVELA